MTNDNTTTTPSPAVVAARTAPKPPVTLDELNAALAEVETWAKAEAARAEVARDAGDALVAAQEELRHARRRLHAILDRAQTVGGVR